MDIAVIITAAGSSTRMGGQKKEYRFLPDGGGTVLSAATEAFLSTIPSESSSPSNPTNSDTDHILYPRLTTVVITLPPDSGEAGSKAAKQALFASSRLESIWKDEDAQASKNNEVQEKPQLVMVEGGKSRQESVFKALQTLEQTSCTTADFSRNKLPPPDLVLIHDGARPFVSRREIQDVVAATIKHGAAACGIPPVDTQKETDQQGFILRHLDRNKLVAIQTPQGFAFKPLLEAHRKAADAGFDTTDDTAIWGEYLGPVKITPGSVDNKKITFPGDLQNQSNSSCPDFGTTSQKSASSTENNAPRSDTMKIRTGLGYDLHRLEEGRQLVLGGVPIPFHKGEAGHSDGDVLLHAITDALLGAAGLTDIGELFPPSDSKWKGADSRQLLETAWKLVVEAGWRLENLDCVVAIQEPKLLPHRAAIRESIAATLQVEAEQVFVKAKTGEKLGPVGTGEAVEVWATCLLTKE